MRYTGDQSAPGGGSAVSVTGMTVSDASAPGGKVSLNGTTDDPCCPASVTVPPAGPIVADGGKTDADKIDFAFRRAVSRAPNKDERDELLALLEKEKQHIADGWVNPNELATGKSELAKDLPAGSTPTQLAAYTVVSRVLLNLDETMTKE